MVCLESGLDLALLTFMCYVDDLTDLDDAESSPKDERPTPISRKLFGRRKQPALDLDDDSSDTSPTAKHTNLKGTISNTGVNSGTESRDEPIKLGMSDEDCLQTMVISSSEDESDHLERVAQAFSTQPSPATPATPPLSKLRSSRPARPRRVVSSQTSDSNLESSMRSRQIGSPTKTERRRGELKTGHELATANVKGSGAARKRSIRSSTVSQRQKKISKDSRNEDGSSAFGSDDVTLTISRRVPLTASQISGGDDSDIIERRNRGSRGYKSRRKPAPVAMSDDSDASSEELVTPARKRRLARAAVASPNVRSNDTSSRIADEIQEDVDDLEETEVCNHRTRATNRTPKKTKVQQQLELLKRRRASQKVANISLGSKGNRSNGRLSRKDSHDQADETSEEASDGSQPLEDNDDPFIREGEDLDQYDEDFVVNDEDEPLGAPHDLSEMPFEFTRHAHKKPLEHFKDAVEWMVHNRLNPAFPRNDPIYQVAVDKLDDYVRGLAGSKFMSAAWNADFLNNLKAKPDIAYLDAPGLSEQHCAACNKTNHPAKFQLIFSGKPYNRQSLEDISDDEDDEDGTSGQDGAFGYSERAFYVGRTCCANAETAHALYHWRYALNQWVLEWLTRRGHTTAEKIIERERWSTKKRSEYANSVVDGMESSGEMRVLYKEFKENLQAARDAKVGRSCQYLEEVADLVYRQINTPMDGGRCDTTTIKEPMGLWWISC